MLRRALAVNSQPLLRSTRRAFRKDVLTAR
jgi:hypothetical protein